MKEYTQEQLCRMWLIGLDGVGPVTYAQWMADCGCAEAIYQGRGELEAMVGKLNPKQRQSVANARTVESAAQRLYDSGARVVFAEDAEYPRYLDVLSNPPPLLYVMGQADCLNRGPTVSMVGARSGTRYGREIAGILAQETVRHGAVVVSGGARGVDAAAHMGALAAGGVTIAVLGTGVDIAYPAENARLFAQICERGALISEYAPGVSAMAEHFPQRNRMVSALADVVLLVEAEMKSGAMITAKLAREQGKPLAAVPGQINNAFAQGPHWHLRNGAAPIYSAKDLLEELGLAQDFSNPQQMQLRPLSADEQRIVDILRTEDSSHEQLAQQSGIAAHTLNSLLTILSLDGIIKQLPGNQYGI